MSRQDLEAVNLELAHLSRSDRLTQLNNRGYWEECLQQIPPLKRSNGPGALVMFDIDHFKKVNDNLRSPGGDEVIRQVSGRCAIPCAPPISPGVTAVKSLLTILVIRQTDGARFSPNAWQRDRRPGPCATISTRSATHQPGWWRDAGSAMESPKQWIECADRAAVRGQARRAQPRRAVPVFRRACSLACASRRNLPLTAGVFTGPRD